MAKVPGEMAFAEAVARNLFKLMSYKDEYEVARLFTDGSFDRQVAAAFEGDLKFEFHLAPPLFARLDPATGRPKKIRFGPWIRPVFRLLAQLRFLRGTPFDPFGYTAERKLERGLIVGYVELLDELIEGLSPQSRSLAVAIASIPEKIRGFGPLKRHSFATAKAEEAALLTRFRQASHPAAVAAE